MVRKRRSVRVPPAYQAGGEWEGRRIISLLRTSSMCCTQVSRLFLNGQATEERTTQGEDR